MEIVDQRNILEEFDVETQTTTEKNDCWKDCCAITWGIIGILALLGLVGGAFYGFIRLIQFAESKSFYICESDLIKCIVTNENINGNIESIINITRDCLLDLTEKPREQYFKNKS